MSRDAANDVHSTFIRHRNWNNAFEEAFCQISVSQPSEMISIIGPSRVGKSRLGKSLRDHITKDDFFGPGGAGSCVSLRAVNSGNNGSFSVRTFALHGLYALNHPIYSREKNVVIPQGGITPRETASNLWEAFTRALAILNIKYLFVDEAQNITRAPGRSGAAAVMDAIKCMAEEAGVVVVLSGTYELHSIMQAAPHVIGRKTVVHFPRYQITKEDAGHFRDILRAYSSLLPVGSQFNALESDPEFFYRGTLGCIGHLERWVRGAIALASSRKVSLAMEHFALSRLSDSDLATLGNDYTEGEKQLLKDEVVTHSFKKEVVVAPGVDSVKGNSGKGPVENKRKPGAAKPVRRPKGCRTEGAGDV